MQHRDLSRRDFVLTTAGTLVAAKTVGARRRAITAQDVADRIRANVGVPWRASSADGIKAGSPTTSVTGIVTTTMATLDVLKKAAASGHNFVVSQEPTFYAANDVAGPRATDPVYLAKQAFIDEHKLVIHRFGDHWNARKPNETATALAAALGWTRYKAADAEQIYRIPPTTLGALIASVRKPLEIRGGLRSLGRLDMPVRSVFISPGTTDVPGATANLPKADVMLAGEPREWEAVPYTLDTWAAGQNKGLIVIGRVVSEAPGMKACAAWLRSFISEVPVTTLSIGDPYWSPTV